MTLYPSGTRFVISLLALLAVQYGSAQDTVMQRQHGVNIKPITDFDQRFYYVPGERQNVWGYRLGVLINDKYKLGIGGYYMNQYSNRNVPATSVSRTTSDQLTVNKKLYLGTIYYEPYLLRRNLWETSLVFETGYGRTVNADVDKTGDVSAIKQNALFIPAGIGLSVNLKLPALFNIECLRWVGINAMAGYRTTVYQQDKTYNYNGVYWSISGAIFLDRVFEDFHNWKKQRDLARNNKVIMLQY